MGFSLQCIQYAVTSNSPMTYQLVLIGGDGGELGLLEYEAPVELLLYVGDGLARLPLSPPHQVDPRLELVHRVQDHLRG
jgi:hypothetical protein